MVQPLNLLSRRGFLQAATLATGAALNPRIGSTSTDVPGSAAAIPMRAITQGPMAHWFGYYDKFQFDPTNRFVLGMEVGFEDRAPKSEDSIRIGMVDLEEGNRWIEIGATSAWCWQQGCMLQWLPGSDSEVLFNIRLKDRYGAVIVDVNTGAQRVLESPVYTVSADGKTAMSLNFARLGVLRPGYGYEGFPDPYQDQRITDEDGITRVDLETGKSELVISLAQMLKVKPQNSMANSLNWFNHLLFSPDGKRFIFLHRWRRDLKSGRETRMLTAKPDGTDLHVVADTQMVSHFIWKNPNQILAWSREPDLGDHFYLYTDQQEDYEIIGQGVLKVDGHCTYSADGEWICTDTYPGKDNFHHLYLVRPSSGKIIELGKYFQPGVVRGKPNRCDLHPRWNRDDTQLCIDSMMSGRRQLYLLDIGDMGSEMWGQSLISD